MRNWQKYWSEYPKAIDRYDYLKQVQSTVGGHAISAAQYELSLAEIESRLELNAHDAVLDLCCGNGLITKDISKKVRLVVGIDFSSTLLDVAIEDHKPENVKYINHNILKLDTIPSISQIKFTKVLLSAALQHFEKRDLFNILQGIITILGENGIILITAVPDRDRKKYFYNTWRRRLRHKFLVFSGRDPMGTWWDRAFIESSASQLGLSTEFYLSADPQLAAYRFGVKLFKTAG